MTLGRPHIHHASCTSTNALLKQLAEDGAEHGTTITAGEQTAGRGRQGRSWIAPAGSALLMSVLVRPLQSHHALASLAAGVAVAETCEDLSPLQARIKWPNDVWLEERKVAGILVEVRPDSDPDKSWLVVGIGLNTAVQVRKLPGELQTTAASLGLAQDADALTPLLAHLDRWIDAGSEEVLAAWRVRDALDGRRISWFGGEGVASGVDAQGNLVVALDDGTSTTLTAGEVHLSLH